MEKLTTIFQEILTQIYNDNISGYKNLLFLIYQNKLECNSNLDEDIFTFLEFLFNEKVILETETQNNEKNQILTTKCEQNSLSNKSFLVLPNEQFFDNISHQKILEEEKAFGDKARKIGAKNEKARRKITYV